MTRLRPSCSIETKRKSRLPADLRADGQLEQLKEKLTLDRSTVVDTHIASTPSE